MITLAVLHTNALVDTLTKMLAEVEISILSNIFFKVDAYTLIASKGRHQENYQ